MVEPELAAAETAAQWSVAATGRSASSSSQAVVLSDQAGDARESGAITIIAPGVAPLAPTDDANAFDTAEIDPAFHPDIETAASKGARIARPSRAARHKGKRSRLAWIIAGLATIVVALVVLRTPIVRALPQTASAFAAIGLPVNLRGLDFTNVRTSEEMSDGVPVLVVEGDIVNVTRKLLEVPRLRFAIRNPTGVEVYAWTAQPSQPMLGPEETMPFRSRLASPPADARDVQVRFFHRRDLESGR